MSALATAPTLFDPQRGGHTLDDLVVGAWEELAARGGAACPVCDGELTAQYGAHARPVAGRCDSCGSVLS